MTRDSDPQDFLPLTPPEFHVLLALSEEPKHGYLIMKEVAEKTGGEVELSTGTLYGIIKRLLRNTWIEETHRGLNVGGRRRRSYRLTALGRRIAEAEAERLERAVLLARDFRLLDPEGA